MNDDIVGRLRYEYGFGDRLEAADEIERLRAENEKLRSALKPITDIKASTCIFEWTPVEALRGDELVELIARAICGSDHQEWLQTAQWYQDERRVEAKAALAICKPVIEQAERERCAKVAEGFEANRDWVRGSFWEKLRREVAAEIRRQI